MIPPGTNVKEIHFKAVVSQGARKFTDLQFPHDDMYKVTSDRLFIPESTDSYALVSHHISVL